MGSTIQSSASCGELTQFKSHHTVKSDQSSQRRLRRHSSEMVLPDSGNVIVFQPFSAGHRKIKWRGRGDVKRPQRERTDFRTWPVICTEYGFPCTSAVYNIAPWGDIEVVCLWLNGYWQAAHNSLEAKWDNTGREGRDERTANALPKGPFTATVILMRNLRPRYNQAKVRVSFTPSQTQAALLFSARSATGITIIGKCQTIVSLFTAAVFQLIVNNTNVCLCFVFASAVHHAVWPGAFSVSGEEPDPHECWRDHEENQTGWLFIWRRGLEKCVSAGQRPHTGWGLKWWLLFKSNLFCNYAYFYYNSHRFMREMKLQIEINETLPRSLSYLTALLGVQMIICILFLQSCWRWIQTRGLRCVACDTTPGCRMTASCHPTPSWPQISSAPPPPLSTLASKLPLMYEMAISACTLDLNNSLRNQSTRWLRKKKSLREPWWELNHIVHLIKIDLFFFGLRRLTNVSVKVSGCRRWTRPHWQREERWKRPVPAQRPAAAPARAPTLLRPPPSLRRRPLQQLKPPCSPPSARRSARQSTPRWRPGWIPSTNHRIQLSTSQDSERKWVILMISWTGPA